MDTIPTHSPRSRPPAVLPVGGVQVASENGQIEANLARALPLVEDGARRGARLILLPEFLPTGYIYTSAIWDAAEPREGPTVEWLKQHTRRLSTIADSDGSVRAQLGEAAGVIVEDVVLDPASKAVELPRTQGRWFGPTPWPTRVFVASEAVGALWYRLSRERRRRARAVSSA